MNTVSYSVKFELSPIQLVPSLVFTVLLLAAQWRVYTKAGRHGWAVLIPVYNLWVLYTVICDRGTAMFRLLIPFYNIYWMIKSMIKLAHAYGKSTGFGVGLILLPPIFLCVLGFGSAQYEGPEEM